MKIMTALTAFVALNKLTGYVLTFENDILFTNLLDHLPSSLDCIKQDIEEIFGISKSWELLYKNCGTIVVENIEYIVYSIYFSEIPIPKSDVYKWIKLQDINTLSNRSQSIIYHAAKQRF